MKSVDVQTRTLLATGQVLSLAGSLLLAGPAFASQSDGNRESFKQLWLANPGADKRELRQAFRADRQERVQLRHEIREQTGGGKAFRAEYQAIKNNLSITPSVLTRPSVPKNDFRSTYVSDRGKARNVTRGLALDLTSSDRSIVLGANLFAEASSYTVNVGGESRVLTSGTRVTSAEFVALQQLIDGGSQSLIIDQSGRGVDGSFTLNSIDDAGRNIKASSLTVSAGVDAIGNFGHNSDFKIRRELVNYGNIYALSDNAAGDKANIGARNITNHADATISTMAPPAVAGAHGAIDGPVDLKLSAERDLDNFGTISSSGSVTLSAGGSVINSGSVSAHSDLNLQSQSIYNSGSISSQTADVNIDTPVAAHILVNNTGGSISALAGDINFRSTGFTPKYDTTLIGGDWYSKQLNLNSGEGHVDVNVHDITGTVNTYAGTVKLLADTDALNIGETVASGDPLIFNAGTVNIVGNQTTSGGPLTVVAGQDINFASGLAMNTNAAGDAGDMLFIAGAAFTSNPGVSITVTGPSATGGNITFTGTAPTFTAHSTGTGDGGDITMAAFNIAGPTKGQINLTGSSISSNGSSGNDNGNVVLIANTINVSSIDTKGTGTTNTGNILLEGLQPAVVGPLVIADPNGDVISGSITSGTSSGSSTITVQSGSTIDAGGLYSVNANSTNVGGATVTADSYSLSTTGAVQITTPVSVSGSVTILAAQGIDIRNNITAPGGILLVSGQDIANIVFPTLFSTTKAGQAGNVTMVAGAAYTDNGTTVTITGASGLGGNVNLNFGSPGIDARGTGLNANGGDVTLVAFASSGGTKGVVSGDDPTDILTGGTNTGINGDVTIVSGNNDGSSGISYRNNINTTGGAAGTGAITLHTTTPNSGAILSKINGGVGSGTFLGGALRNSSIFATAGGKLQTNGGTIDLLAGRAGAQSIDIETVTAGDGAVRINAAGIASNAELRIIQGGGIVVTATGNVSFRDSWNTTATGGGILVVSGENIQNITSGDSFTTTVGAGGQSGSVTFVAGATFSETATDLTITGASATGGVINLGNNVDFIDTSGVSAAKGGDVNLIAYADAAGARGTVFFDNGTDVTTQGNAGGNNGNILVVAGHNQGSNGIRTGGIWTTAGGLSGTGNITLLTAQPITGAVLSKFTGSVQSGGFTAGAVLKNGSIVAAAGFGATTDSNSNFNLTTGNVLDFTNTDITAGRARISVDNFIQGIADVTTTGSITITSRVGDINLRGNLIGIGGVVLVSGGAVSNINAGDTISTQNTGDGGDVVIASGAAFTENLVNITITGASNNASNQINLGNGFTSIDTRGLGGNSAGGNVTIVGYDGGSGGGSINVQSGSTILTGGSGSGINGNVVAVSGKNDGGTGVQIDASITTTGGAAGSGDVTFSTTTPSVGVLITKSDASLGSSFLGGAGRNSQVFQSNGSGGITVNNADVLVNSGAALFMQGVTTGSAGTIMYNSGLTGSPFVANFKGVTTGSLSVTATGDIDMRGGDIIARTGVLFVAGANIQNNGAGMVINTSGANDAGNIAIVAGAAFTQNLTSVTVSGASTTGGNINLSSGFLGLDSSSTAGVGDGGDITLVAFADTATGANGVVLLDNNLAQVRAGGSGSGGANGDVLIIGSNNQLIDGINIQAPITVAGGDNGTGTVTLKTVAPGVNVAVNRTTIVPTAGTFDSNTTRNSNIRVQNTITADGGNIDILSGRNVVLDTLTITPSAVGDAGFIRVEATGSEVLQIASTGNNRITDVNFDGGLASGDGGDFSAINNGTQGINIFGNILVQNNNIGDGGNILIDADQGTLSFNAGPVAIRASGQGASPQNGGSITLLADTLNFNGLHVDLIATQSAGGGNGGSITVVTDSTINIGSGVNQFGLQAQGPGSTVTLTSTASSVNLTTALTLTNLNLSSTNANITQTAGAALNVANVDFTLFGGTPGIADFDNIVNNVGKVSGKSGGGGSGGTIFLDNGANNLLLGDLGATQSLTAKTTGTMATAENINTGGDIVLTTANLTNNFAMVANSITVTSQAGAGLTVSGTGGSFNATGLGEIVQLNATGGDLNLFGTQTYVSVTEMNVLTPGSTFIVNSGANIAGQQLLTVNTDLVSLIGIITGNPLVINSSGSGGGTIANSIGDVNLSGDIILNGNFAIIAFGNVNAGPTTSIDLSGVSDSTLTVLSGFNFAPATAGQVTDSTTTFTGFTANATGGSINLANVDIDTSGTGSAGGVLLIANGGSTNTGSISVGNIDASSSGGGGADVRLVGEGAITVGNINTTGGNSGSVEVIVASSLTVGSPQVLNGTLSGGNFIADVIGIGNITTGDINAGGAQIDIETNGPTSSIATGDLIGHIVQVNAGTGNLNLSGASAIIAPTHPDTSSGGTIRLESNTLTLNNSATAPFLLTADGVGTGSGGTIIVDTNEQSTFFVGNVAKAKSGNFFSISAKGGATGSGGTIDLSVGGNLSVNTAGLQASAGTGGNGANIKLEAGAASSKGGSLAISGNLYVSGPSAAVGGKIELITKSSKSFTLGDTTKAQKNGVMGQLTALGISGGEIIINNRDGGVLVTNGNGMTANSIELRAGGKGTIASGDGAIITALQELELYATTGDIGKKTIMINAPILTVDTAGAVRIDSKRGGLLTLNDSKGKSLKLTTIGALALNDITAHDGDICMTANSGTLSVAAGKHIEAINGEICLLNCNALSGNISLGANSIIETSGNGERVLIAIGATPTNPVAVTPPANVIIDEQGNGKVIFATSAAGFVVGAIPTKVNAINKNVILSNASTQPGTQKITFEDNVTITADPPLGAGSARSTAMMFSSQVGEAVGASNSLTNNSLANNSLASNSLTNIGSVTDTVIGAQLNSITNSALNAQNITAVPTDLLSSFRKTAGEEITSLSSTAIGTLSLAEETVPNTFITEAYVWCDTDLGLHGATTLKRGKNEIASSGSSVAANEISGGINGASTVEVAKLRRGTLVLAPSKDTRLETPMGTVEVAKDSVALVVLDDTRLGVYDLHDARKGSIRVSSGSSATTLSPGRCTVLTNQVQNGFERSNPMESIGYKSIATLDHGNGIKAFNAEFSTTHAMESVKPLMQILTSKHAGARRLGSRLLKTSAVLMHLGGGSDNFKIYAEPSVTAMSR
ncbi:MAG: hypothetical protein SGJ27_17225 [Candidatus Melainabacteria bacterium]|nr:hypothetical protein [Candidatus Melainabacteria bacterium]